MVRDVLVFTPVYRLEPATIAAVMALEWEGPLSFLLQRDNPHGVGKLDHLHQYERGRQTFLAGSWDGMLVIESDIVPPADALQKLAALDADCAYGVYTFRGGQNIINVWERYPGNPRNEGESLSIHPQKLAEARRRGVVRMSGGGLGCVLIKRHVLEATPFRLGDGLRGGFCDTYFNRDVMRQGLMQMADMSVECGHVDTDGVTLWPS